MIKDIKIYTIFIKKIIQHQNMAKLTDFSFRILSPNNTVVGLIKKIFYRSLYFINLFLFLLLLLLL